MQSIIEHLELIERSAQEGDSQRELLDAIEQLRVLNVADTDRPLVEQIANALDAVAGKGR